MQGLRKVISGSVILLIAVGITYLKGDVPKGLGDVLIYMFGFFVVGNALEHGSQAFTDIAFAKAEAIATQPTEAKEIDLSPILAAVEAQKADMAKAMASPDMEQVKQSLTGVVNQNAVIAQSLNDLASGVKYLVTVVQQSK
jgi:hypothetical protein